MAYFVSYIFQVILECAVGGSPMPEILWTKDGKPVTISNRIQQLTTAHSSSKTPL